MPEYRPNDYVGDAPKGWGIRPTYHATKYDSAAAEVIAALADETEGFGMRDDSTGDVEASTGYVSLVVIPPDFELTTGDDQAAEVAREYGVTPADVAGVHIVTTNSQGFVDVTTFPTEQEAREAFDAIAEEYTEYLGDDDA